MLIAEPQHSDSVASFTAGCDVHIRLAGGARDRETIALAVGNHSVGSGPRCSIRLRDAGVGPMHCLITCDDAGMRVRRWSNETLLNGETFQEAPLSRGDYLSIGPIDLEIVGPGPVDQGASDNGFARPTAFDAAQRVVDNGHDVLDHADEIVRGVPLAAHDAINELGDETAAPSDSVAGESESPHGNDAEATAQRSVDAAEPLGAEILWVLQGQREQFDELFARVDELGQKVELALADKGEAGLSSSPRSSFVAEAPETDFDRHWPIQDEASIERERAAWTAEKLAWTEDWEDLVANNANLQANLSLAQRQLEDTLTELAEAQATIDNLQTMLADGERAKQELSDERAAWQQQLADLEEQLASYAAQAKDLQDQLHRSQLNAEAPAAIEVAAADLHEVQAAPAWPSESVGDHGTNFIDDVAAAEVSWTTPEVARDSTEKPEPGYDWSAHSPGAGVEPAVSTSVEDATGGAADWVTQTPSGVSAGPEAMEVNSVEVAGEEVHAVEHGGAAEPVESAVVAEPQQAAEATASMRESDLRLSGDVGAALAALRELSIWREVPESAAEPAGEESSVQPSDVESCHVEPNHVEANQDEAASADASEHILSEASVVEPPVAGDAAYQEEQEAGERSQLDVAPVVDSLEDMSSPSAESSAATVPDSFIERYAHMFEKEDRHEEASPPPAPALTLKEIMEQAPDRETAPAVPHVATPASASAVSDADDSMEHYMARMMQRIRGDSPPRASSMAPASPTATEGIAGLKPNTDKAPATTPTPVVGTSLNLPTSGEALISMEELKRKVPTPEFTTDMGALRALANQTTRHAIGVHTTRTLRRNALTRFLICLLASTTTVYFLLGAPSWQSYDFSVACVSLIAALYWGRLTFMSLIKAVRVGAFDDLGSEFAPIESLNPPLPIDIERR